LPGGVGCPEDQVEALADGVAPSRQHAPWVTRLRPRCGDRVRAAETGGSSATGSLTVIVQLLSLDPSEQTAGGDKTHQSGAARMWCAVDDPSGR
jgi:hypothetical protein